MKLTVLALAVVVGVLGSASADETTDTLNTLNALKQQILELDQKVRVLERRLELDGESAAAKAKETPRISVGSTGVGVASADTNFVFKLNGLIQVDNRTFFGDSQVQGGDTFLLRRARPIFQGTLYRDFDFNFTPDFGGSSVQIVDAFINYRYRPWLQLRAGKFKVPVGLEHLQSDPVTFFNERSVVSALVPNRDIGFQLWGDVAAGRLAYAAGVFNGVGDARSTSNSDFENHREVAARLFATPFKNSEQRAISGLGFGVGGSWGTISRSATGLPGNNGYGSDGQQGFFSYTNGVAADGDHWRVSPQAYYYFGPFGLLTEYAVSSQEISRGAASAEVKNSAWQVAVGWVLTGEDSSFTGVTPAKPFDLKLRQFGALQLVARYAELDVDDDVFPEFANPASAATAAQTWSLGLNWFLNRNLRINTSFSRVTFDGGAAGSNASGVSDRPAEEVLFSRVQLAF